ncbi:MAG: alpha/beta hydrolase [Oscillospiraceae bacterium]|nr:alpha/beta hydrolase [Oscillospiraceae bacterium]
MLNARNARLRLDSGETDYIRFGNGTKTLVMLPGVGDGLKTVKGMAMPFSLQFRELAKDFTVYVFSRRVSLPEHMTTREMAEDLNAAMEALDLRETAVVGVSQGGMIAQWLAVDHPDKVGKLVLVVTLSRPNETVREAIAGWTEMAERGDYRGIMLDTAERSYSEKRLRQARLTYSLLGSLGRPNSFDRFLTEAESCVTHDCYDRLGEIACPTLVIGGCEDRIVTAAASEEIAQAIPGSELYLYEGLSHGLYEEAPDFLTRVAAFCR